MAGAWDVSSAGLVFVASRPIRRKAEKIVRLDTLEPFHCAINATSVRELVQATGVRPPRVWIVVEAGLHRCDTPRIYRRYVENRADSSAPRT